MRKTIKLFGYLFLISLYGINEFSFAQNITRPISNPQTQMIGARYMSLGGTNPAIPGDINGVFINPATISSPEPLLFTATNQKLMGYFDYQFFSCSFPLDLSFTVDDKTISQKLVWGLSYGSNALQNIPQTTLEDERIRQLGTFSAGFDIICATLGTDFYDKLGFDRIAFGLNTKLFRQYIDKEQRSAVGVDVGGMATYVINNFGIDRLHLGASVLNLLGTPLIWDSGGESYLALQPLFGLRIDTLDDQLSVFLHTAQEGVACGVEWAINENFILRSSTDFKDISFGSGLIFSNIAGFGEQRYGVRFDYNYTHNNSLITMDPDNTLSISILGEARPQTPQILEPAETILTRNATILLAGLGSKKTTIRIYNNNVLTRTTSTDRYGKWEFKNFPLHEGRNDITIKAYSLERDSSIESNKCAVYLDTTAPQLLVSVSPMDAFLKITVQTPSTSASDELTSIDGMLEKNRFTFKPINDTTWEAMVTAPVDVKSTSRIPTKVKQLLIYAIDKVGNETGIKPYPFFAELSFPKDKQVHYRNTLRCLGKTSALVKKMSVNNITFGIDKSYNCSATTKLVPGKNLLNFKIITQENQEINYTARVLRLVTFPDLNKKVKERREIEFMATLGLLGAEKDGNFYPDKVVTRMFLTKMMIKATNRAIPAKLENDVFPDIPKENPDAPYVAAAISEGLIYAYPDGTFKPDNPLTLTEAIYLLSNAGIIDEETIPNQPGYVKRRELALYLAYTPKFEIKIERLIDWEKGYE